MKLKTKTLTFYWDAGEKAMKDNYIKSLKDDIRIHQLIADIKKMMIIKLES